MPKLIDLKGKKYGDWTVISVVECDKHPFLRWLCRCKCGTEQIFTSYFIRKTWKPTDCGCSTSLVGKKFGALTVIQKIGIRHNTISSYNCICDCGIQKTYRGNYLMYGKIKSCGCKRTHTAKNNALVIIYNTYRNQAKRRDFEFNLKKERFEELITSPCFYCKKIETNKTAVQRSKNLGNRFFLHNGIDRIDNNIGYTEENSIPCCQTCNYMKKDMTFQDWKKHMELILTTLDNREKEQQTPAIAG